MSLTNKEGVEPATIASTSLLILDKFLTTKSFDFSTPPSNILLTSINNFAKFTTPKSIHLQLINATDKERENLFMALNSRYEITNVLPPPNHDDQQVVVMAFVYMLLFVMGTCGNAVVLSKIYDMVKSRRLHFVDNTVIYIVVLCCVDFGVCLSLPMTVIDQILGFWMFGSIVCKIHAVLENFGKVFSALILTAMSFDRYAGVCHPQKKILRSTLVAICILVGMIVYALFTLSPLLWNFTARDLILFEKETAPHKIIQMRIEKCTMVNISSTVFTVFTGFLFFFCFVVPLFLVGYFYSQLWCKLRQHARQFKASQIPLMRISLLTLVMAFFYFICWAPFWFATVYAVYLEHRSNESGTVPPIFVYFMYFIHALPFTNSAVNWILYGLLNRQLQRKKTDWCCMNSHTDPTMIANGPTTLSNMQQQLKNVSANRISLTKTILNNEIQNPNQNLNQSLSQRSSCCIQPSLLNVTTSRHQQIEMRRLNPSLTELHRYASAIPLNINAETQTEVIREINNKKFQIQNFSILPYTDPSQQIIKNENNCELLFDLIPKKTNSTSRRQSIGPINPFYNNEPKLQTHANIGFIENNCNNPESVDLLLKIENDATFL